MTLPENLMDLLTLTVGLPIAIGVIKAYVLESIPGWATLSAGRKRGAVQGLAVICAIGIFAINEYIPGHVIEELNPLYVVIVAALQLASTEFSHRKINFTAEGRHSVK